MKDQLLSNEEQSLLDEVEAGNFESKLSEARQQELSTAVENTFKKDKRINIRISSRDLQAIQSRSLQEGIPYQTLISSVLHKYVSGSLLDVTASKVKSSDS
ncbi:hypothetical protein [Umboniibacter marinipuniceus]|uniref:Putative DNA binding CopG/RHH family protein n=1 Tax=Umboniibacter marinipuniceus TaxID=569599 RepID=A0A3M0AG62_9GAMM|nr:hypothetical protein [Umboniibacter marinipuniceus]RMA82609.1 putative DNA binding CopG/RHH family protein [Umboniibacter marinipuniceus]